MILSIYNPSKEIPHLSKETIRLVRVAKEPQTMKDLLSCYDILKITETINEPWECPGMLHGDRGAFQDLYRLSGKLMIAADPSREAMICYTYDVKRLILFWQMCCKKPLSIAPFYNEVVR